MGNTENERIVRTLMTKVIPRPSLYFTLRVNKHCNLNCKGCCAFAPLIDEESATVDEIEEDLKRLSFLSNGEVSFIDIMGGEALLHPDIVQIIELARKYFNYGVIRLVTNGLLLEKQDENFWMICKENHIVIAPTKYPINIDYKKIECIAKDYGIEFEYFSVVDKHRGWVRFQLTEKGNRNELHSFLNCNSANVCANLYKGRIYPCARAMDAGYLNQYFGTEFKESCRDYIDIYDDISLDDIMKFLAKPIPFCRYCNTFAHHAQEWGISKKEIDEWI